MIDKIIEDWPKSKIHYELRVKDILDHIESKCSNIDDVYFKSRVKSIDKLKSKILTKQDKQNIKYNIKYDKINIS